MWQQQAANLNSTKNIIHWSTPLGTLIGGMATAHLSSE
jgi:hypothetical protein